MKYVIYGAGKRGKEELEALGKENVIAFIDKDENKIGTNYCHLPVIAMQEFAQMSRDILCIITPIAGHEDILRELQNYKIENYLFITPYDRMLYYCRQEMFDDILRNYGDFNVGIYGISAGSILLYHFLRFHTNKNIVLIPNICESKERYTYLNCVIENLEDAVGKADVLINTDIRLDTALQNRIQLDTQLIKAETVFERNFPFKSHEIEKYKNIHKGQRCFIVATGPSLTIDDLNVLQEHHEICISMNRIYNIFEKTQWRPHYYVIEDQKMIEDLGEEIAGMDLPVKFVSSKPESYWLQQKAQTSIMYQLALLNVDDNPPLFSTQLEKCIYAGSTVTYICLQLAAYMGFHEIYLLGVDFNYSKDLYHEANHFEGYDKDKKIRLNDVYPEKMEQAYERAEQFAGDQGIRIYNATRGGKLEVFERIDFDRLF